MLGENERGHTSNYRRRHRRPRLLLVNIPQPRAENIHARRRDRDTLQPIIRKRRELIVSIKRCDAEHVRYVVARWKVWVAIIIRRRIACRRDEQNVILVSLANHVLERARTLR